MSQYIGSELEIFEHAKHWKNYYASFIKPSLGRSVAEVGAGLGGTTPVLCDGSQQQWICIEPDPDLVKKIEQKIADGIIPSVCKTFNGYLTSLTTKFDSIIYIDVIEHIENDKAELEVAAGLLSTGGYLIILVPAHQKLFSEFDRMIGHFRRYNRNSLKSIIPQTMEIE